MSSKGTDGCQVVWEEYITGGSYLSFHYCVF